MLYAFIRPLVDQAYEFADNFPEYVEDAKEGRGADRPARAALRHRRVDRREPGPPQGSRLQSAGAPAARPGAERANTVAALRHDPRAPRPDAAPGPDELVAGFRSSFPHQAATESDAWRRDCSRAVTGYMGGNLLISIIAGTSHVHHARGSSACPFSGVLALWVAFADLIPLVGATLGAIPSIGVAFLHSPPPGIVA